MVVVRRSSNIFYVGENIAHRVVAVGCDAVRSVKVFLRSFVVEINLDPFVRTKIVGFVSPLAAIKDIRARAAF